LDDQAELDGLEKDKAGREDLFDRGGDDRDDPGDEDRDDD